MYRYQKWRDLLQLAPDVKAVNALMGDYVAVIEPAIISALPPECQRALVPPINVQTAAVTLLQAELQFRGSAEEASLIQEVAHTFASASVRITTVHVNLARAAE